MLKKLVKYDLIWINKTMIIFFLISLIVSSLTRIISLSSTSFIGSTLYFIFKIATVSCIVSTLINCVIRIWTRFRINLYKDEAYLTHTLPVTRETLYNSKIVSGVISIMISLIAVLICILIVYLDQDMIDKFSKIFKSGNTLFTFINVLIITILEVVYMAYCGIIGLILGHKSNNNKMVKSVLIGIGLYFVMQMIIFTIIFIIGMINSDISILFNNELTNDIKFESAVKLLTLIVNAVYILFIGLLYMIGKWAFKKGVDVE